MEFHTFASSTFISLCKLMKATLVCIAPEPVRDSANGESGGKLYSLRSLSPAKIVVATVMPAHPRGVPFT
jgi:hypothetical protein